MKGRRSMLEKDRSFQSEKQKNGFAESGNGTSPSIALKIKRRGKLDRKATSDMVTS